MLGKLVVRLPERRLVKTHPGGELAEDLAVRQRFAERIDRRIVREHVKVPIRFVHIDMLELSRRRQNEIGVIGRVGLKVLQHDGEKVFTLEACRDLTRLRSDRDRVAVVDDQGIDRRNGMKQVAADR